MDFFEKSPRETYLIVSLIENLCATKDAPILKRLFVYHRKDIQRLVWHMGIKYYLLGGDRNLKITAALLAHSLKEHPATIRWDENSEAAQKIKELDAFKTLIEKFMENHPSYYETRSRFYGNGTLDFAAANNTGLYLSLGKVRIKFHASYKEAIGWVVNCTVLDK